MQASPVHLLIAILILAVTTMFLVVALQFCCAGDGVLEVIGVAGPLLASLMALKIEWVRRLMQTQMQDIHQQMGSMKDEAVQAGRREGVAEGRAEGIEAERNRSEFGVSDKEE